MNVTEQIRRSHAFYGGSDNNNPAYNASNKSLNYAKSSNSMINAQVDKVTAIPAVINYQDTVGLFGAENIFIKVQLNVQNTTGSAKPIEDNAANTYIPAMTSNSSVSSIYWEDAKIDYSKDLVVVNTYAPASVENKIDVLAFPLVNVDIKNLKTGNKYLDAWFDVRLYTKNRIEHPYDRMYIDPDDYFYIGFHARDTKRLPYNVSMTVGSVFVSKYDLPTEERRYLVN